MGRLVLGALLLFLVAFTVSPALADTGVMSVVAGKTYQVNYNANGVKIQNIETNPTYEELTVSVQVSSPNALLELTIPRDLLDSKQGNNDIPFITVIDGTLGNVEEKNPTSTTRTISIQLAPGNQQIEIIGTFVAISGPNGGSAQNPSSTNTQTQTTPTQTPPSSVPQTPSPTTQPVPMPKPTPQTTQTTPLEENSTSQLNLPQNIVFKIPYLQNVTISLSQIDLAVISAIALVVIIVIASVARRRPARIAKKL
ncbi:MAG TPA: hypothetical protein VJ771_00245 [Candidatus Nitrosotalea sp.]|nr:hypothetical protein [Candidatus Nitrosotalea sp.]